MSIFLKFLGVRGSRPTHKRKLLGYGGNSTSFEIKIPDSDFHLFVDGGSGLAHRGQELANSDRNKFHFLITHTHWDHILGLPFFSPLYRENNQFTFHASNTTKSTFNNLFAGMQRGANLPVPRDAIKANIEFKTVAPGQEFLIENKLRIKTFQLNHQGITLAYRIETLDGKASVCIVTDNAPIEGNYMGEGMLDKALKDKKAFESEFNQGLIDFLKGANTVVFDTHFTEQNLKADWGHSTPPRALEFCRSAKVSRLILFHHAPEDKDLDVDNKVHSIFNNACRAGIEVEAAREGDEWDLCG